MCFSDTAPILPQILPLVNAGGMKYSGKDRFCVFCFVGDKQEGGSRCRRAAQSIDKVDGLQACKKAALRDYRIVVFIVKGTPQM